MRDYDKVLRNILENGQPTDDRTGVGTFATFGERMEFDLNEGFPAITTKRLAWKSVVSELLWFLEGSDDERRLAEILYDKPRAELVDKKTIWTDNADNQGKNLGYINSNNAKGLGPVYGVQWTSWYNGATDDHHNQIIELIDGIKNDPYSRRHILNAWNVGEIEDMALPPCHVMSQFHVQNGKLSCQMYQRSADMFLGIPFNIASYALLTHMIASITGYEVGKLIIIIGDAHIYKNHVEQVKEQLSREHYPLPTLTMPALGPTEVSISRTKTVDYILENYNHHPTIKAEMAV
jgi:thymidylate synthase|tara:strand:+ start:1510 stop:2385 length:876 start_codon:yes stop_codon:yes gene_type:complete